MSDFPRMNNSIDLPPLPEALIAQTMLATEVRSLLRRYGERCWNAAIEADRKHQYRPVYEEGWKDALEWAERNHKRKGGPVLWIAEKALRSIYADPRKTLVQFQTRVTRTKTFNEMVPLYADPQHTDPCQGYQPIQSGPLPPPPAPETAPTADQWQTLIGWLDRRRHYPTVQITGKVAGDIADRLASYGQNLGRGETRMNTGFQAQEAAEIGQVYANGEERE